MGSEQIDQTTLPKYMEKYKGKFDQNADEYYQVLLNSSKPDKDSSVTAERFKKDILGLGDAVLDLMIAPKFHRKVAMVRKTGMKIMDKGGFSNSIPFAGVLYVEGEELNQILRKMENPQHTKWEEERAEDDRPLAKKVKKALNDFIRESLNLLKDSDPAEIFNPETGEFLSFIGEEDGKQLSGKNGLEEKIDDIQIYRPAVNKEKSGPPKSDVSAADEDEQGGNSGAGSGSGGGNGDTGGDENGDKPGGGSGHHEGGQGDPSGNHPRNSKPTQIKAKVRVMSISKSEGKYRILIRPEKNSDQGELKLDYATETDYLPADLKEAETADGVSLKVSNNTIKGIELEKDHPVSLIVWLKDSEYRALEGTVYAV